MATIILHGVSVTPTSKGHRVWLQGLGTKSARWCAGTRFTVNITADTIHVVRDTANGKRAVVDNKGGIIDLTSKKVSQWAGNATSARVTITDAVITITREG